MLRSIAILVLLVSSAAAQVTWYVDARARSRGEGSQGSPYGKIMDAMEAARPGDTILVAAGVYRELVDFGGRDVKLVADGAVFLDGRNRGTVVTFRKGEGREAVLQGFTIINGLARTGTRGGAIRIEGASPTIRACHVTRNTSSTRDGTWSGHGGAISIAGGLQTHPQFESCLLDLNRAGDHDASPSGFQGGDGGAVHMELSQATFVDCEFRGNSAGSGLSGGRGGAIYAWASTLTMARCLIADNTAGHGSQTGGQGGFLFAESSDVNLLACEIVDNRAGNGRYAGAGGAIAAAAYGLMLVGPHGSAPEIRLASCIVARNEAGRGTMEPGHGGAFFLNPGLFASIDLDLVNCTVADNRADPKRGLAGALYVRGFAAVANIDLENTIVWGNQPNAAGQPNWGCGTSVRFDVDSSNVENAVVGGSNISVDPQFAGIGDYHLQPTSPCVNAGDNDVAYLQWYDIDGEPRLYNHRVDIGADEAGLAQGLERTREGWVLVNYNLIPGLEYHNLFSPELAPNGPGTGLSVLGGLAASTPSMVELIVAQLDKPVGSGPLHFIAEREVMRFGPWETPDIALEGLLFSVTDTGVGDRSPVLRLRLD